MLTALRHDRKEGWEARERPIVAALLPHMARAQQAVERMRLLDAGEAALNALNLGALLLDADGSVIFHNDAAAQAAIHAGDGLQLRNGKLNANNADADAGLQRLIAFALKPDGSLETPPDVLVPRQSLRQPYHVTALPIRRSLKPFVGIVRPVAVVIVNDPERRRPIGAEALRRGYGLTPREAALAVALADGWSLEQAADLLEMRYETARTHLRRVLSKTRTSRQAELLKLLAKFSV
jgi:DNA-binding CsgD family transcriptional regulator